MEATTSPETGRSKRKREAKAAFERRAIREALEARIRKVLSTPPGDRTPEGWALLDEHAAVVAPLMANLTRSLRRKAQTEERLEEREDPPEVMMEHVAVLVQMIRQRGTFVMHTGAGFSTAAAIPDFRGRNGIWTQQAKGRAVPMPRFENTKPTKAHLAAVALYNAGYLTHVITQNVDGLHQRAGMPADTVSVGSHDVRAEDLIRVLARDELDQALRVVVRARAGVGGEREGSHVVFRARRLHL